MPPRSRRSRAPRPSRRSSRQGRGAKEVITITHAGDARPNIATAELEPVMADADRQAVRVAYQRRNRDLDPQLVWRGKDAQDASDLVVDAPPLFIQEKIHPKALVDDLVRLSKQRQQDGGGGGDGNGGGGDGDGGYGGRQAALDLFADFNGLEDPNARTDFYRHEVNWSNRLILGDSLPVMASLAEREGLRGQVQCIYIDPPYGIRFNSNFQWSTTSRDVRDGNPAHITREPEQVKAFRDTWRDGIHSYLSYLRDRLTVARDLLSDSGSVFVQIGDENVHRVRAVMDEVFGEDNFVSIITIRKTTSEGTNLLGSTTDFVLWYGKDADRTKFNPLYRPRSENAESRYSRVSPDGLRYRLDNLTSSRPAGEGDVSTFTWQGREFNPGNGTFKTSAAGLERLALADRLYASNRGNLNYCRFQNDFGMAIMGNLWTDISGAVQSRSDPKVYVVQTSTQLIERCVLLSTDPGDLVLDPTCGAGTTAYVAEQWGRRWITIDTSRVALALARARLMGARYPYYLLADSPEGQRQAGAIANAPANAAVNAAPDATSDAPPDASPDEPTYGELRQGFVYQRVPHITLRDIANNGEIDAIWDAAEGRLAPLRRELSEVSGQWSAAGRPASDGDGDGDSDGDNDNDGDGGGRKPLREWELPRECPAHWPAAAADLLAQYWAGRGARQRAIDASIAANANFEFLYDQPYADPGKVRVAGPFTVESLSPHRVISADEDGMASLQSSNAAETGPANREAAGVNVAEAGDGYRWQGEEGAPGRDFAAMILENLRTAGVQQAHKDDKIDFSALVGWPGEYICAEGRFVEGGGIDDDDDGGADGDDADDGDDAASAAGIARRAAIFVGPEFGTVSPADLTAAAREAGAAGFDLLISCAFSYDAHASALRRLGALPILKARMNADLHMADDLKNTGQGNLFVVFGEPDVELLEVGADGDGAPLWQVKIRGVDIYHPGTGQVRSHGAEGIACWFVDTDYNEASFFVRQAYFLGASSDPYRALKTTLKAEVDADAWASLRSDTSRPFPRPASGRIAVKVINHLGDEAMKILLVG